MHAELGSTNDAALAAARAGDAGNLWIVAKSQTQGRGRQGRQWSSPPGNLYTSLLLFDPSASARAPELGFVVGVALAHALRRLAANDSRLRIKWPNDILLDGAKLAGILLESVRLGNGRLACVIGIGVNCLWSPRDLPYRTAALSDILAMPVMPDDVLFALSAELIEWLDVWAAGAGFAQIRAAWLSLAAGLGGPVKVAMPNRQIEGTFRTIDEGGRLLVDTATGPVLVEAGDVFFVERAKGARVGV